MKFLDVFLDMEKPKSIIDHKQRKRYFLVETLVKNKQSKKMAEYESIKQKIKYNTTGIISTKRKSRQQKISKIFQLYLHKRKGNLLNNNCITLNLNQTHSSSLIPRHRKRKASKP